MSTTPKPSLSLGPIYYLWDGPKWRDFYFRIADEAPVTHVVLGETVCSKRQHFTEPHLADVVDRLEAAGKRVTLSSLAMVTLERESQHVRSLVCDSSHPIEANDLAALGLLRGTPHSIGPLVNVYNATAARVLAARGAENIRLPPELPMRSICTLAAEMPDFSFEIFAFGRMPVAISARCAHARSKGLTKDNCQFICSEEPDGLPLRTLDSQSFLVLNGVQTMSHSCVALVKELREIASAGISRIRLSPQDCDMVAVAQIYDAVLSGRLDSGEALTRLVAVYPSTPFSNGFYHQEKGAAWVARARNGTLGA
ncbi:ubiquinone anaerobic biosynthesis protein UbiV [Rhizobium leguminosarum]|uniref:ubiquinone anaerobic biosynthesis protein UbiV n=1 Tax=Rhizobium leguminosarum TaxID=384 RepID=UPI00143F6BDA|nr:U32 family peptidase [Rhizobium leguminosarum]NKL21154.1 U32 family peptidase [Rhizobium leguminosarum bv. viciae]